MSGEFLVDGLPERKLRAQRRRAARDKSRWQVRGSEHLPASGPAIAVCDSDAWSLRAPRVVHPVDGGDAGQLRAAQRALLAGQVVALRPSTAVAWLAMASAAPVVPVIADEQRVSYGPPIAIAQIAYPRSAAVVAQVQQQIEAHVASFDAWHATEPANG